MGGALITINATKPIHSIREVVENLPLWADYGPIVFINDSDNCTIWVAVKHVEVTKTSTLYGMEDIGKFEFLNENGNIISYFRRNKGTLFPPYISGEVIRINFRAYLGRFDHIVEIAK